MPTFEYAGLDIRGAPLRGRAEFGDEGQARARLRQQGLAVLSLRRMPDAWRSSPATDVALLTRYLAMLVKAGLPLLQALQVVAEQTEEPALRDVASSLAGRIQEGKTLYAAMQHHPVLFPPVYLGVIRYGESSGRLDQALELLAAHLEREQELKQKVHDALVYPALVLVLAGAVVAVFMTIVIPAFDRIYRSTGASLPFLTQVLMRISALFRATLPLTAAGVAAAFLPPVRSLIRARSLGIFEHVLAVVPRARRLQHSLRMSRFTHTLGTMLSSGVPLLSALEVAGEAAGPDAEPVVRRMVAKLEQGRRLHEAMRDVGQFSPIVMRMVAMGEASGALETMLGRVATILDQEFDRGVRRLMVFLEPILTLGLAGIIGLLLMALYLPIFNLSKTVGR